MALEFNLTNQMQMSQQMKLTPAMMQSMEILQLPMMALEQRIETELNINPVLEFETDEVDAPEEEESNEFLNKSIDEKELKISDDNTAESFERLESLGAEYKEYVNQDADVSVKYYDNESDSKMNALHNTADNRTSMQMYLKEQLTILDGKQEIINVIEILIDHLTPKGYLSPGLEEIASLYDGFDYKHFVEALELLQKFDPPGIGARDVKECLLIQISQNIESAPPFTFDIINNHYNMLLNNHLPQLAVAAECNMDDIKKVLHYLSLLDTSPGAKFNAGFDNAPVRVDIIVEEDESGEHIVRLANSSLPAVRINDEYAKMAANKNIEKETRKYLQENVRNAKWLIEAINQRQNTLLKIATVVVSKQEEFFKKGKMYIQPLFMQEVADYIGMHIATVSRAVAGKHIRSPQGQISLRELFTSRMVSDDGSVQGTEVIKQTLREIVNSENKSKPYNDEKLALMLKNKGYVISRRTVVKYRQQMDIPTSRMRKKFI